MSQELKTEKRGEKKKEGWDDDTERERDIGSLSREREIQEETV